MSKQLFALVEGESELALFENILKPHLKNVGLKVKASLVGGRGGHCDFERFCQEIKNRARESHGCYITMFFDYYALNVRWPDIVAIKEANAGTSHAGVADNIETCIKTKVYEKLGTEVLWANHFIPYVQLYELEALLFSHPENMANVFQQITLRPQFENIVTQCKGCENINDSPQTAPSKRITALFRGYRKGNGSRAHVLPILERTGLDHIRKSCPRFDTWLSSLEKLP